MNDFAALGAKIKAADGPGEAIKAFLRQAVEKKVADAVLVPVKVPAGNSYAWILVTDMSILDDASPVAPVMPVQGAKALKSLTRKGHGELTVMAVMRPCEIRATFELLKLNQVNLEKVVLVSYDCPGAIPFRDYVKDPGFGEKNFQAVMAAGGPAEKNVKPACVICDEFSRVDSDIHFGWFGESGSSVLVIPSSDRGVEVLGSMGMECSDDIAGWKKTISGLKEKKTGKRTATLTETAKTIQGLDGLLGTFSECIGCHNCMAVCPICYCRQCYFDSEVAKKTPDFILETAKKRGGLAFPSDRVMFHTGRMTHMSLSCVSCGMCTDACPVDIHVAEVFSYMADITQPAFEYTAGRNDGVPLPLRKYEEKEVPQVHEIVKEAEGEEAAHE
ncbi:MAG: hypothetical protein KAV42_05040 [Candidatus Krumholzibacteria bacterium]|nr:hypothetical protein [Candidatus Krumholzibacteria bacterium]